MYYALDIDSNIGLTQNHLAIDRARKTSAIAYGSAVPIRTNDTGVVRPNKEIPSKKQPLQVYRYTGETKTLRSSLIMHGWMMTH